VLVLLEEFNVLGYLEVIEAAAGQIAGYGVKLWCVLQACRAFSLSRNSSRHFLIGQISGKLIGRHRWRFVLDISSIASR